MTEFGAKLPAKTLVAGQAAGESIILNEPLSFWGGFNPENGKIVDQKHPQAGATLTNKVLVMPSGRGSSSASSILAESIRRGTGPRAIVLKEADAILALGSIVAAELYRVSCPIVQLKSEDWEYLVGCSKLNICASAEEAYVQLSSD